MKNVIRLFYFTSIMLSGISAFSQKYRSIDDTANLNKEYVNVSNDIVALNAKLSIAQNDLPGYQAKAKEAYNDAANAASVSSNQANKATNGSVGDAKTAKKKAGKAYNEAKDSRAANKKVSEQENKITRYKLNIKKRQQRLEELDVMRAAIHAKMLTDSLRHMQ